MIYNYGGVSLAKVNENLYGPLSCQVLCIATGGGNLSAPTQALLQTYLIAKSILGSMDVRVEDATLVTVTVDIGIKVKTGYVYADIEDYIEFACKIFFSETGKEIIDKYDADGISDAITLINSIFTYSFTSTDNTTIIEILERLKIVGYRNFDDDIQEFDFVGFLQVITGIDYITITDPAFPLSYDNDEISTHTASSFTLAEI